MAAYLAQVECRQMMRAFARSGSRVPLHCSAVGKTILLSCSVKALSRILHRQGMPRPTVKIIVTPALLRADLERTRAAGHAIDDEEHAIGLRCLAAPITNENGEVIAAVSVSGPMARMTDERIASVTALVVGAARSISRELGGMGSGSSL